MTQGATISAEPGQPDLFLAGGPAKRDWEALAGMYGKSVRTLKRYDQDGREAGDLCPLESPEKMAKWWQAHMKHQVPVWLLKAAEAVAAPAVEEAEIETTETLPDEIPYNEEVTADEMGLEKTLERLAKMEVVLSRQASKPGQNKAWLDTIARMGNVAEKLRIEAERLRDLIPRAEAEKMIHEYHAPIERETRQLARTMCEITGIPFTPHVQEAWNKECDRLFARFQQEVLR